METYDILTNDMHVGRPVLFVKFSAVSVRVVTETRYIVGQRVQPYVYDVSRVALYGYAP